MGESIVSYSGADIGSYAGILCWKAVGNIEVLVLGDSPG